MSEIDYDALDEEVSKVMADDMDVEVNVRKGEEQEREATEEAPEVTVESRPTVVRGRYMDMVHPNSDMRPPARNYATGRDIAAPAAGVIASGQVDAMDAAGLGGASKPVRTQTAQTQPQAVRAAQAQAVQAAQVAQAVQEEEEPEFGVIEDVDKGGVGTHEDGGGFGAQDGGFETQDEDFGAQDGDFGAEVGPAPQLATETEVEPPEPAADLPLASLAGEEDPNANNYSLGGRSPFIPDAKVEKRPLGDYVPEGSTRGVQSTKNVYSQRTPVDRNVPDVEPMVVGAPKKRSGWMWALVTLLVVVAGGGLGVLVFMALH